MAMTLLGVVLVLGHLLHSTKNKMIAISLAFFIFREGEHLFFRSFTRCSSKIRL